MKTRIKLSALVASGSLVAVGVLGVVAFNTQDQPHNAADRVAVQYSDAQILNGVVLGQGDVVRDHPEIATKVVNSQPIDSDSLAAFDDRVMAAVPDFHSTIAVPLRSGDPYVVNAALSRLNSSVKTAWNPNYRSRSVGNGNGEQDGALITKENIVTNTEAVAVTDVAAVWQAAAATTVAGAAEAVVVVAVAPAVATYQFNVDSPDQILKSSWVAKITAAMSSK